MLQGWLWVLLSLGVASEGPRVVPGTAVTISSTAVAEQAMDAAWQDLVAENWESAARQFGALGAAGTLAEFPYLEALCRYELGQLRRAEKAAGDGLMKFPDYAPLLSLQGLIWTDLGRGRQALELLARSEAQSRDAADAAGLARSLLHQGLVYVDLGEHTRARERWEAASREAAAAGLEQTVAEARAQLDALDRSVEQDLVGSVAARLRRGEVTAARELARRAPSGDTRERVRQRIATAMVERSEGRLDLAAVALEEARSSALDVGLVRELATAQLELGLVYRLAGRKEEARVSLQSAYDTLHGTSFVVRTVDALLQLGRQCLDDKDVGSASEALAAIESLSLPPGNAAVGLRVAELRGLVQHANGSDAWRPSMDEAAVGWAARSDWVEAARVGASLVRLQAARGQDSANERSQAQAWFERGGDPRGPAHVWVAEGLGRASSGQLEAALQAFVAAAEVARALEDPVSVRVAGVAEANAAEVLRMLGHRTDASDAPDVRGALKRHDRFSEGKSAYEAARGDFDAARYARAREGFEQARDIFAALGEAQHVEASRRGWAWSVWNEAAASSPAQALALFDGLRPEADKLGDTELSARALAGAAIAAGRLGRADAVSRLRRAVTTAESSGLVDLHVRCLAALAESSAPLDERGLVARAAYGIQPNELTTYAMYSVAVDAYNSDRYALAVSIAGDLSGRAGDLEASVAEVLEAARSALGAAE